VAEDQPARQNSRVRGIAAGERQTRQLGYARALGKMCIGLKTDDRALLPSGDNPMILVGCHELFSTTFELVDSLRMRALSLRQTG
jgi:hypothetical protein